MRRLPVTADPNLLVGSATADDAGVYRIGRDRALVQTVDFFTPVVDDPFVYGQIAAANALSDVYAMGGRPLTALNLLGIPTDLVPPAVIHQILRGGAMKAKEARCAIVGGHTIRNAEPIYGLSVTGLVAPSRMITNSRAAAGDLLVLTKPLGTGIATTAIKRGLASPKLERMAIKVMRQLNVAGAELAERRLVRAATDVTGYSLLGHLGSMCRASKVGAVVQALVVPVLGPEIERLVEEDCVPGGSRTNLEMANTFTRWDAAVTSTRKHVLTDAQTSGGLLLCVPSAKLKAVMAVLRSCRTACAVVIGEITGSRSVRIRVIG